MLRKSLSVLILFALIILSSCQNDPIQDELLNYVNTEMITAHDLEKKAVTAYESVTGVNFTNDGVLYDTLQNEVIPTYEKFLKELHSVKLETDELKDIHDIYINAAETQYEAFGVIIEALEQQDPALVQEANALLEQGRDQINDYQSKLNALAEEHNVNLKKD